MKIFSSNKPHRKGLWPFARTAAIVAGIAVVALMGGLLWIRTSLPTDSGKLDLPGLQAPVTIVRDARGIPFIKASSEHDAMFALGFVHAQDRLFQMDLMRRAGQGRLSEFIGPRAVPTDRMMRILGLYKLAEANYATLSPDARAAYQAYADGVNAYIDTHKGAWPPEYYLFRIRPEKWKPADSLVWGRLMTLRLSRNWRAELLRARLATRLSPEQIDDLWPPYPKDGIQGASLDTAQRTETASSRDPEGDADSAEPELPKDAAPLLDGLAMLAKEFPQSQSASNCFLVDGRLSATGKPILANDPHLSFEAPGIWYLARISIPGFTWAGATTPGVPTLLLGHNGHVAWGMTSTESDTQDLFLERLDADNPTLYDTPDGPRPFVTHDETIHVRGAPDVTVRVRSTRHGPVISDALPPAAIPKADAEKYVIALADSSLRPDDGTAEAVYRLDHATDAASFKAALRTFDGPPQNFSYADTDGAVGFIAAGRMPIRKQGDGDWPVPGWTGDYDWTGFIPFDALPQLGDPPSGRIVTANHKIVGESYPYFLSKDWGAPYRDDRINALLERDPTLSVKGAEAIQQDVLSPAAGDMLPLLLAVPPRNDQASQAIALLKKWDHVMDRNRPEPLIYSAWLVALMHDIAADELGPFYADFPVIDPLFLQRVLTKRQSWCEDVTPDKKATDGKLAGEDPPVTKPDAQTACSAKIAEALVTALADLDKHFGKDMSKWRWGDAHRALFINRIWSRIPVLAGIAEPSIKTGGDDDTVDRGTYYAPAPGGPFVNFHGPGYRAVYDLADLDRSAFAFAPGESGNLFSSHYADTLERWRDGRYFALGPAPATKGGEAPATLELLPAPKAAGGAS